MAGDTDDSCPPTDLLVYSNHFNQPYLAHSYNPQPECNLDCCSSYFESPVEMPFHYVATLKDSTLRTPQIQVEEWANLDTEPIGQIAQYELGFSNVTTFHNEPCSPQITLPTPPICSDVPTQVAFWKVQPMTSSSHRSSRSPKHDFPCSSPVDLKGPTIKGSAPRKRGRPHLHRDDSSPSTLSNYSDEACMHRLTHNKVERKYRNGLNVGIERLRCAVPTLPQGGNDVVRPSKLTVLAGAVAYIQRIEQERDAAVEKLDSLTDACIFTQRRSSCSNRQ